MGRSQPSAPIFIWIQLLVVVLLLVIAMWLVQAMSPAFRVKVETWSDLRTIDVFESDHRRLSDALRDFVEVAGMRGVPLWVVPSSSEDRSRSLRLELVSHRTDLYDGYVVSRFEGGLLLQAATEVGLANGLYGLARDCFGARWYWAEDIGFEMVGDAIEQLPKGTREEVPAFVQRTLHPIGPEFGRRNRLVGNYSFNHNLAHIFDKEAFEQFPEAFSVNGGRRKAPNRSSQLDWNPNLASDAAIQLTADAIREHFDTKPESTSFSISTNDNSRFHDGEETQLLVSPLEYFRGRPNYTDLVFYFSNRVAEEVFSDPKYLKTPSGEDRYLGALAYYWMEQSPSFPLHPRVMPILTSDRAQWHDPAYRAEDKALVKRWSKCGAERIATWDYYFGAPYPYPRQFTEWIAESIPFLSEQGLDVFFSQLPSVWGLDGPKGWLASELLWDPGQDTEALLAEFYSEFFGPTAGPIRRFYEYAESYRAEAEGEANWIKFYNDEAGVDLFNDEALHTLRGFLDQAIALSPPNSRFRKRVEVVSDAFEYTEAYYAFHQARKSLFELSQGVFMEASPVDLDGLIAAREEWRAKEDAYGALLNRLTEDPLHSRLKFFDRVRQSDPTHAFLGAYTHLGGEDAKMLSGRDYELADALARWRSGALNARSLISNRRFRYETSQERNFLGPKVPVFEDWILRFRPSEGLSFADNIDLPGQGLKIKKADFVDVDQTVRVRPNRPYVLNLDLAWRSSPDCRVLVHLAWRNIWGESLEEWVPLRLYPNVKSQELKVSIPLLSPAEEAKRLRVRVRASRQYEGDFLEIREIDVLALEPKL